MSLAAFSSNLSEFHTSADESLLLSLSHERFSSLSVVGTIRNSFTDILPAIIFRSPVNPCRAADIGHPIQPLSQRPHHSSPARSTRAALIPDAFAIAAVPRSGARDYGRSHGLRAGGLMGRKWRKWVQPAKVKSSIIGIMGA
jgi:hypothetical protein